MKAEDLAKQQREISISEFFEKNRHLLGYDNKIKALLMIVKEGVDNSLDACEETGILPEVYVSVKEVSPEKYVVIIKDNGPGIVKAQIPRIFGKLLYGSKFHRLKQSRGQQGIGISANVLYCQLTTGEPLEILTSIGDGKLHKYKIKIDVKKNEPLIMDSGTEETGTWTGLELKFVAEGLYREHKQSILEYMKQTAIANPHASMVFDSPNGRIEFRRGVESLPKEPREIQHHLHGVELGIMSRMLKDTKARTLVSFLTSEFTKVGRVTAKEVCSKAGIDENARPRKLGDEEVKKLMEAVKKTKLLKPPTDCLSPLGNELIIEGLRKELNPEFVESVTRSPEVYRGWPFQIEVGVAFGGSVQAPKLMRFANRVPLLYQQGDCAITKSSMGVEWKRYGLSGNGLPEDPVAIFVHMASVWVPFTSESKEAIASYPVIIKEIKLALQECARKLGLYLSGKRKAEHSRERKRTFEKYAEETANALHDLTGEPMEKIRSSLLEIIGNKINGGEDEEEPGREAGGPREESGPGHTGEKEPEHRAARQVTLERVLR